VFQKHNGALLEYLDGSVAKRYDTGERLEGLLESGV
jgi:hypothetical protein